jgi:zinc transport system substrate-binding protein
LPILPLGRRAFVQGATAAALLPRVAAAQASFTVAAVNYPLAWFAERLAGDLAEVIFPVPPGTDPSFWRPGIAEIAAFQSADLILLNGAGFAAWTQRATLPRSRIVNTSAAFEGAYIATETVSHSHGEAGEHSHTGTASYTWLDFGQALQQAVAIAEALRRVAPQAEDQIARNLDGLTADLEALDAEAREIGAGAAAHAVISSHPRYQYFGRAYGLTLDAVDWDASEPPSEAQWLELERLAQETGAGIFLWEAAPDADAMDRIRALGMANAVFPPLANRPDAGDFLSGMTSSLESLREAVAAASGG